MRLSGVVSISDFCRAPLTPIISDVQERSVLMGRCFGCGAIGTSKTGPRVLETAGAIPGVLERRQRFSRGEAAYESYNGIDNRA